LAAVAAPAWFTAHGLTPHYYFESVLFILGFLLLGQVLDHRARHRATQSLAAVTALQPTTARRIRNHAEETIPATDIAPGDTLLIRPGERIPADGQILSGRAFLDESLLTGESIPIARHPGDRVIAGSLSTDGALTIQATQSGQQTVLAQMLRLMEVAQSSRAPMQKVADRISAIFVPCVLAIALATLLCWGIFAGVHGNWSLGLYHAIAVLVIACPCAMGLAVPASVTVAIGRAAQLGILIKGGEALERLATLDTLAFDKTGTLTLGSPRINSTHCEPGIREYQLIATAAAIESESTHPLASAVLAYASERNIAASPATAHRTLPGRGAVAEQNGETLLAGNPALLAEFFVTIPTHPVAATTRLYIARGKQLLGWLDAEDQPRPEAPSAIAALRALNLELLLLTGDNPAAAATIASELNLTCYASLLPEQKLEHIRSLQLQGHKVGMVGDGINDAAALAQSDAGIAMGTGTDLAQEAGDILLLGRNSNNGLIQRIPQAIALARAAHSNMRQNLFWAAAYNALGIPLAAGLFGINLSPSLASASMAFSSLSVLLNSLRLARWKPGSALH
jgi:Cu+-exporting ATPase